MPLSGPGFFTLSQTRQLATPAERLQFLEAKAADGTLDIDSAVEIATDVGIDGPGVDRLRRLGQLLGEAPLFMPRFAAHRDTTVGAVSGFSLRLREMMDTPAASSAQGAIQRVMQRHRDVIHDLGPRERTEWGLVVRLTKSQVKDPLALEAGLENILKQLSANRDLRATDPRQAAEPLQQLQGIRRQLLLSVLEHHEYDALYRYTRDHAVNAPLRQHYGRDNIPSDVMATSRPTLPPESQGRGRPAYQPLSISTGAFISSLDGALATLRGLQGADKLPLFRATLLRKPWVDDLVQSGRFQDHGYVSTSRYTDKVPGFFRHEWSTRFDDEVPVLMVFETRRSVDISCLSRFTNESEHLIPRGESFQARLLGYRRDLCPDVDIPDSENWAVFVMTDDGLPPAAETVRTIKALGATAPTT
jgi:hypothetical protein